MKKHRFLIIPVLLIVILGGFCFWLARNFMPCTERFNGVPLDEFEEATKVIVKSGTRTPFEITPSNKVEYAKQFIENRHDGWGKPCMVPVSPLLSIIFVNEKEKKLAYMDFGLIQLYTSFQKSKLLSHIYFCYE